MKTAISLPDDLFARADKYAQGKGLSRSALVAEALREYIDRHKSVDITKQLNEAIAGEGQPRDEAVIRQSKRRLKGGDW
ncbi:MAG: ribbon-helix-helix domain-containing protein [Planctomycetota bacterium]|jgi:metal-responsive CopG/Arc/MetJ family transcriptional regulator|nr:ribbon-helix-helix domain-containing protein [Planctomycetota bacterium]